MNIERDNITDYFHDCKEIIVYIDGSNSTYNSNTPEFAELLDIITTMTADAREMPAYGVALDHEIKEAKNTGLWVELVYEDKTYHNEMPFERLLFQVNKDYTGFNLNRFYDDKYEGRCFYLNLNGDMTELYNYITRK